MKKTAVLLGSLLLGSCHHYDKDLVGHWVAEKCTIQILCSFDILEQSSAHSELYVKFDDGIFSEGASGPLVEIEDKEGEYYIETSIGQMPLTLKDDVLYDIKNTAYKKQIN